MNSLKLSLLVCAAILAQSYAGKVRLCVGNPNALEKCQALADAMRLQNAGSEFECTTDKDCVKVVADGTADATVVDAHEHPAALKQLEPVLFESYDESNLIVAIIDADKESKLHELPLSFEDKSDLRLLHAASYINLHRNDGKCVKTIRPSGGDSIKLERYHEVKDQKNKKLVCIENEKMITKPISEFKNCHVESNIPNAVMVKKGSANKDEITKALLAAAEKVGRGAQFQLFGEFKGKKNLIFSDETKTLVPTHSEPNGINVDEFVKLHCGDLDNHDHAHDHGHHHDHDHDHAHEPDHDHAHDHAHDHSHDHKHDHDHHEHEHELPAQSAHKRLATLQVLKTLL